MKIQVDGVDIFELTETQKKVIQNDICCSMFEEEMKRRLFYIINEKYNQCFKRLKAEWEPKLIAEGATSLPTDKDEFAALIFAREDYKDAAARKAEENPVV